MAFTLHHGNLMGPGSSDCCRYYLMIFVPIGLSTVFFANTLYSPPHPEDLRSQLTLCQPGGESEDVGTVETRGHVKVEKI